MRGRVAIARGRPIFFLRGVNFFFLITAIESNIRPAASAPLLQGGWWGVTRGLFKMGLPRPSPKLTQHRVQWDET